MAYISTQSASPHWRRHVVGERVRVQACISHTVARDTSGSDRWCWCEGQSLRWKRALASSTMEETREHCTHCARRPQRFSLPFYRRFCSNCSQVVAPTVWGRCAHCFNHGSRRAFVYKSGTGDRVVQSQRSVSNHGKRHCLRRETSVSETGLERPCWWARPVRA